MGPDLAGPLTMRPRALDATGFLPHSYALRAGTVLGLSIASGIALVHMAGVHESLAVLHQHPVDRNLRKRSGRDQLGHQASIAIGGLRHQPNRCAGGQMGLEPSAAGGAPGGLVKLGGIDAGEPHRAGFAVDPDLEGITISNPDHGGLQDRSAQLGLSQAGRVDGWGKQPSGVLGTQGC